MRTKLIKYLPGTLLVVVITLVSVTVMLAVRNWIQTAPNATPTRVQVVTLVMPPPQKIEEKIEPEKQQEVKLDEPEPAPLPSPDDQPSPGELGLDEDGSGTDGWLAARKGGRGLLDGNPYGWFTGQLQKAIYDALSENQNIRKKRYSVIVSVWLENGGKIKKIELQNTSGDKQIDKEISNTLKTVSAMAEAPPDQMPQPVNLRIASRG
ncbi:MAG: TonB C-terminal domain-containing protein [Gammaproteobacteria bacterium]|nr:TonB C-terminal domain-containing protein [Gammaproteobacteria bacterium]